jgi:hypothetical protein
LIFQVPENVVDSLRRSAGFVSEHSVAVTNQTNHNLLGLRVFEGVGN